MSQVMVWKSDNDGKLFENKPAYLKHLRKLARAHAEQRAVSKMQNLRNDLQTKMGEVISIAALEQFIKDNWDWFYANGVSEDPFHRLKKRTGKHEYVDVKFIQMRFGEHSNSHSCPRNGVTNWDRRTAKPGTPTGYPGWRGQVSIKVKTQKNSEYYQSGLGSDYFKNTIISTGTGGGGGITDGVTSYTYEVILWSADFPGLVHQMDQKNMWKDLGGQIKEKEYAVY